MERSWGPLTFAPPEAISGALAVTVVGFALWFIAHRMLAREFERHGIDPNLNADEAIRQLNEKTAEENEER